MKLTHDLFLLMFNLSQLQNRKTIVQLFCESMSELFKPVNIYYEKQKKDGAVFVEEINTRNSSYGFLYSDINLGENQKPLIQNAVQMLAVILERLNYENQIKKEKESFEQIAEERLVKINQHIKALERSKLASLNLVDDLTDEIRAKEKIQKTLKESEERFRSYIENAPNGIFVADENGDYIEVNESAERITGYSRSELLKMNLIELIYKDDHSKAEKHFRSVVKNGKSSGDMRFVKKDQEVRFWTVDAVKLSEKRFLEFVTDITDRKLAEEQIKASLKEKEVLLQEVHHRVKNNLQLIISMLKLEIKYSSENQDVFSGTISRIRKFSDIHNKLYIQEDISNVDFGMTIKEIVEEIINLYSAEKKNINLKIDIPDPILSIDLAIPLALIINELITNSMKYAFENTGQIEISLFRNSKGEITKFVYSDNGRGMGKYQPGFGTKMVNVLADQLGLDITISSENGCSYNFVSKQQKLLPEQENPDIIYVEDEFIIALERIESLQNMGYSVNDDPIGSGEIAIDFIKKASVKPSLILMDIGLSGELDGIEAAKEIRKNLDIPIIFMTGYDDFGHKKAIKKIPNSCFIHKTCSDRQLKEQIDSCLKKDQDAE